MVVIYLIAGIILGTIIGWLIATGRAASRIQSAEAKAVSFEATSNELRNQLSKLSEEKSKLELELNQLVQAKVKAETELKNATERIAEQKKLLEEATAKLTDVFKAIASDTLNISTKNLLELAKENFAKFLTEAKGDFGKSQEKISGLLEPLTENLRQFDDYLKSIEKNRESAYTELKTYLQTLKETQNELREKTSSLVTALRTPHVRGKWGEMTLRRVVELAGMSEHCDFEEQVSIRDSNGTTQRPDMIIHLPDDKMVVVDAKVSLDAYLLAIEATNENDRKKYQAEHARQIKNQVDRLIRTDYSSSFAKAPEFTIMFIPGESFFSAALEQDKTLFEYALENKVVIATPATLMAILRAISYSWRQAKVMQNAEEIVKDARELYERISTVFGHISELGSAISKAVEKYNNVVGSINSRMLPSLRRFQELGVVPYDRQALHPEQVERLVRSFEKPPEFEER